MKRFLFPQEEEGQNRNHSFCPRSWKKRPISGLLFTSPSSHHFTRPRYTDVDINITIVYIYLNRKWTSAKWRSLPWPETPFYQISFYIPLASHVHLLTCGVWQVATHFFFPSLLMFTMIVRVRITFNQSRESPVTLLGFKVLKIYLVIIFCLHLLIRYYTILKLNVQTL